MEQRREVETTSQEISSSTTQYQERELTPIKDKGLVDDPRFLQL